MRAMYEIAKPNLTEFCHSYFVVYEGYLTFAAVGQFLSQLCRRSRGRTDDGPVYLDGRKRSLRFSVKSWFLDQGRVKSPCLDRGVVAHTNTRYHNEGGATRFSTE